ncbi:hypothetical protein [Rhizobium binxianense]
MSDRSSSAEVRNPLLRLPAAARIRSLSPEARQVLADLLRELSLDARQRAETSWRQNKAPMAVYWKAVGVYAAHLHRVIRLTRTRCGRADANQPARPDTINRQAAEGGCSRIRQ